MFAHIGDDDAVWAEAARVFGGLNDANDLPERAVRALRGDRVLRVTMKEAVALRMRIDELGARDGFEEQFQAAIEGRPVREHKPLYGTLDVVVDRQPTAKGGA